jgi:deoxycytidylate deaminase
MKLPIDLKQHLKKHPKDVEKATVMALVIQRGRVIEVGYNRRRFPTDAGFTIHAEEAVLKKAGRRARHGTLLVIRYKKNGEFGLAKPCPRCDRMIAEYGVSYVQWSKEEWNWEMK